MPFEDLSRLCAARRALLLGVGAAGVVALTGCGGDTPQTPVASAAPTSAAPAAGSNPFDNNTASAAPGDAAPPTGALVPVKEVPVGGGVLADAVLVVQPKAGTFKAYEASCPHQGIMVDPPTGGADIIMCPGHNSQFKTADGSLVRGPATRGLRTVTVKVQAGYVVQV